MGRGQKNSKASALDSMYRVAPVPYNYPTRTAWTWKRQSEPSQGRELPETHAHHVAAKSTRPATAPSKRLSRPSLSTGLPTARQRQPRSARPSTQRTQRRPRPELEQVVSEWWEWTASGAEESAREAVVITGACLRWLLMPGASVRRSLLLEVADADLCLCAGPHETLNKSLFEAYLTRVTVPWIGPGSTTDQHAHMLSVALKILKDCSARALFEVPSTNSQQLLPVMTRHAGFHRKLKVHQLVIRSSWLTNVMSMESAIQLIRSLEDKGYTGSSACLLKSSEWLKLIPTGMKKVLLEELETPALHSLQTRAENETHVAPTQPNPSGGTQQRPKAVSNKADHPTRNRKNVTRRCGVGTVMEKVDAILETARLGRVHFESNPPRPQTEKLIRITPALAPAEPQDLSAARMAAQFQLEKGKLMQLQETAPITSWPASPGRCYLVSSPRRSPRAHTTHSSPTSPLSPDRCD